MYISAASVPFQYFGNGAGPSELGKTKKTMTFFSKIFPIFKLGIFIQQLGVTVRSTDINRYANYKLGSSWCE